MYARWPETVSEKEEKMLMSELIARLQKLLDEGGDAEVQLVTHRTAGEERWDGLNEVVWSPGNDKLVLLKSRG